MIPRFDLIADTRVWAPGSIHSSPEGRWVLWEHVEPLIFYALNMGAPMPDCMIPEGIADGAVEDPYASDEPPVSEEVLAELAEERPSDTPFHIDELFDDPTEYEGDEDEK